MDGVELARMPKNCLWKLLTKRAWRAMGVRVVSRWLSSTCVGVGGRPRKSLVFKHLRGGRGKQKACQPRGWHGDFFLDNFKKTSRLPKTLPQVRRESCRWSLNCRLPLRLWRHWWYWSERWSSPRSLPRLKHRASVWIARTSLLLSFRFSCSKYSESVENWKGYFCKKLFTTRTVGTLFVFVKIC